MNKLFIQGKLSKVRRQTLASCFFRSAISEERDAFSLRAVVSDASLWLN